MAAGVYATLNTAIRERVISELQDGLPIPTKFDNQSKDITPGARWLRAAIVHTDTEQIQVGGENRYRMIGEIEFEIHFPAAEGTKGAREVAAAITAAFRGVTAASVVYRASDHTTTAEIDAEWVMTYTVPFYSDFDEVPQDRILGLPSPTRETVYDILVAHFKNQVQSAPAHAAKQFFYDNFENPPASGSWSRVSVMDGEGGHQDSAPSYRTEGNLIAEVFVPVAEGTSGQIGLVDDIAAAFRAISVKGVQCRTPRLRTVTSATQRASETGREDSFWQMNVICPYHFSDQ